MGTFLQSDFMMVRTMIVDPFLLDSIESVYRHAIEVSSSIKLYSADLCSMKIVLAWLPLKISV